MYDKVICEIADHFQQPDCLVYKNIQGVFLRLRNLNYDLSISLVPNLCETGGDIKVQEDRL